MAIPIVLLALPFLVKNLVFTGNPVYPFLHRFFPSPFWNDTSAAYYHTALRRFEIGEWRWHTWFTFPYHMVLRPRLIDVQTGLLPLLMVPFLFLRSAGRGESLLKVFLLGNLLTWYLFQTITRSLLTFFAVLFVVAAPQVERRLFGSPQLRRAAFVVFGVLVGASLIVSAFNTMVLTRPLGYLFGLEGRREFLRREVHGYRALEWLNGNPAVRGVLLVGMKRPYYVEKPAWFSAFADRPIAEVLLDGRRDPAAFARELLALGITHVAVDRAEYRKDLRDGLYGWGKSGRAVFEAFLERYCERQAGFGGVEILRIRSPGSPATSGFSRDAAGLKDIPCDPVL